MRFAFAAITVLAFCLTTWAADDPFVGKWQVNVEKTKAKSGTASSATVTFEAIADGYRMKIGDAEPITVRFDGKDYPRTTGNVFTAVGADAASARRINSRTIETTFKRGGKAVATVRREISADGRVMTSTSDGVYPDGKKLHNVVVYDKQ